MTCVYTWGQNKFNQISSKKELHLYSPTLNTEFESQNPFRVATGDSHTLVLTDYGDVFAFGRGKEGQLGLGDKVNEEKPKMLSGLSHETVVDVACGSLTSYAVTSTGKVYQW